MTDDNHARDTYSITVVCQKHTQQSKTRAFFRTLYLDNARHKSTFYITADRKSPAPYPMVTSMTFYNLPFSHNTFVTDQ